ncbi:hypothetical protein BASA81_004864 [Batrachochytrium salamandrivorans]|nr:hypothetical protein BASA81_004864 [Batrachochytrium salamandrivorans]
MLVNIRHRQLYVRHSINSSPEFPNTTIFFVHGAMASMENYRFQFAKFEALFEHVVAYDYFGCGMSPKLEDSWESYSTEQHSLDLAFVFHKYKSNRNILVGHSFGTNQVLRLCMDPETLGEITGVVLLAPAIFPDGGHWIFRLPEWFLSWIQPKLSESFAERAFHANTREAKTEEHAELLRYALQRAGSNNVHVFKSFYNQIKFIKQTEVEQRVPGPIPIELVVGSADLLTPMDMALRMKQWLDARIGTSTMACDIRVVDLSAHQLMEEQPEQVNQLIETFCRQVLE